MIQEAIVFICLLLSVAYLTNRLWQNFRTKDACGKGCGTCSIESNKQVKEA